MKIDRFNYPDGLYYSKDHFWVKLENGKARVGITDIAQVAAGDIVFVRTVPKGKTVEYGKPLGTMETGKWVGPLKTPLTGQVIELNEALKTQPKLLNTDPYGQGWIAVIQPSKLDEETKNLMTSEEQLKAFVKEEMPKIIK